MNKEGLDYGKYVSPRWSAELLDCSMPMTLDTYSHCSFGCLYCFSFYQKANTDNNYLVNKVGSVNVEKIKRVFLGQQKSQFSEYVRQKRAIQWGGLADGFDEYERKYGVSLELLKFFREIDYPISISTKSAWWAYDPRYAELLKDAKNVHVKVSIITSDEFKASKVEVDVPTPKERLKLIEQLRKLGIGGVTLRFRPFIIGISSPGHVQLIRDANAHGADSVSTEFLCVENRSAKAKTRFEQMSRFTGYNILQFYRRYSPGQVGYLRLGREVKRKFIDDMNNTCDELGMRFYVSDAHFKERCHNGSCCGLTPDWNYSRGHYLEALLIAKEKGEVRLSDVYDKTDIWDLVQFYNAEGFNTCSVEMQAKFNNFTMRDYFRYYWNNVNSKKSPYMYFGGILIPGGTDMDGNVIYKYRGDK